jgi:hypothetical protein
MGDFLIKISSQGGHGCNREAKAGEVFEGCGRMSCPDCFAAELVQQFARRFPIHYATFTHWPVELNKTMGRQYREEDEVVDDIHFKLANGYVSNTTRKRIKGKFNP